MGKKKNKKSKPLKATTFDIANYGVTKAPTATGGTSSTSFTGGTPNWDKVSDAKSDLKKLMGNIESSRDMMDNAKLRKSCIKDGGKWDPKTNTCIMPEEETQETPNENNKENGGVEDNAYSDNEKKNKDEVKVENGEEIPANVSPGSAKAFAEGDVIEESVENENVEIDDDDAEQKELSKQYGVEYAKENFKLKNIFKKRSTKFEFDEATRNSFRAQARSLATKIRKAKTPEEKDKLRKERKALIKKANRKLLRIKGDDGVNKDITEEQFDVEFRKKYNLRHGSGQGDRYRGDFYSNVPTQFRSPMNFRSPFARRSRGYLNLRKDWMPTQSVPMNHGSPLHQEQTDIQNQQFGSIWNKMQVYGEDMPEKIDKFVKHVSYDPEINKPIESFQNQQWVQTITKWLQDQKSVYVKARNSKNNDEQQRIVAAVNTLIQDVTTYSGKFMDWIARNSGDQTEGNAGGSVVSEGSKKDERFIGNITFMGDTNTNIAVGENGKIGIKSFGLDGVKFVEELDSDVFAKDDMGFLQFTKISEQLQKDAESGKPLNENVVKGNADQLLTNKDSILSWAFDPLYGQSWLQDYAQGNPNADLDVFMPESPKFDIDYLTDELHGWLTSKLTESYTQNAPQQPEQKGDAAQGIMDQTLAGVEEEKKNKQGVYAEGGEQPQQPAPEEMMAQGPPQGSPMGYRPRRSRAKELINRYTKLRK